MGTGGVVVGADTDTDAETVGHTGRHGLRELGPVLLLRSAHPRIAVLTALGVALVASLTGRPLREVLLVLATVLVGQAVVGWHLDLVDRRRPSAAEPGGSPLGRGLLEPGTVWFAIACATLLLVPLAVANGLVAGASYLISWVVALLGNVVLRRSWLSWLPAAVSYALLPAFVSYGGWGGQARGEPPEIAVTALAAALGVCVHVLTRLPHLVEDNREGYRHLALRIALRTGAPRLLWATLVATGLVVAALAWAGTQVGLAQ
jgi:hypothetical protein